MKSKKEYIIPFIGLKLGFHEYHFDIRDSFFEERDYSIVHNGKVTVQLILEKKETMMIGEFSIAGSVSTECDRCTDMVEVLVKGDYRLVYKFDTEPSDDETLIVLHPDDYELDLHDNIYELITVSLPTRLLHPKGECNEEMLELLKKYTIPQAIDEDDDDYEDEEDWDEEDDEEDWEDENDDGDDDGPIDSRWNALKNLN